MIGGGLFQSTPLIRGETWSPNILLNLSQFQSTPLIRGETNGASSRNARWRISIHSPHTRGDLIRMSVRLRTLSFQSTPLIRGETSSIVLGRFSHLFQSTSLIRGETWKLRFPRCQYAISIHFPHTRGDLYVKNRINYKYYISIHFPHTRGDFREHRTFTAKRISIHFPHTRGDDGAAENRMEQRISIHFPHTRGDICKVYCVDIIRRFQSTSLIRGETRSAL